MKKIKNRSLLRIIDANVNRAKEGLRVCEDIFRFIHDRKTLTREFKKTRHALTEIVRPLGSIEMIANRDIRGDVGKKTPGFETKRRGAKDILLANLQRVKESIRVLEEIFKIVDAGISEQFKQMRYRIYDLEKKTFKPGAALFDSRSKRS